MRRAIPSNFCHAPHSCAFCSTFASRLDLAVVLKAWKHDGERQYQTASSEGVVIIGHGLVAIVRDLDTEALLWRRVGVEPRTLAVRIVRIPAKTKRGAGTRRGGARSSIPPSGNTEARGSRRPPDPWLSLSISMFGFCLVR
ncbi:hypothetical protein ml_42 [Mollivirus sibericum]|uniref:hypothetical protein n=1 Tax=Mollivirus sibericum TaxID=1678078 RepID=UPI0006B2DB07|nr:hypothetical protein ml_42 [Mollivirus sibericum]ALD61844.1 hypothetical protein ml_42 [Mollivirus sibericum]